MKSRFFQLLSIVTLSLAIGLAPVLACACQGDGPPESHSCCPEQGKSEQNARQASEKQACCDLDSAPLNTLEFSLLDEAPLLFPLGLAPDFESYRVKVSIDYSNRIACEGSGDTDPPEAYLKNHSFLL